MSFFTESSLSFLFHLFSVFARLSKWPFLSGKYLKSFTSVRSMNSERRSEVESMAFTINGIHQVCAAHECCTYLHFALTHDAAFHASNLGHRQQVPLLQVPLLPHPVRMSGHAFFVSEKIS